ncbi:MAG: cysteine desulfurase [Bacteroidales bacterium]|nr:cysteine desulfurase [Bacteroidales bacterium]MBR1645070.1 cysteine desulfurase [Bacteroidales bacterium]
MNRNDFPILSRTIYDKPLVYLDNAATTQKPRCVIDAISEEYCSVNANVHRGVHFLSSKATELHEGARERVRTFINAASSAEIIFTRGTTESLNLMASSYGEAFLHEGDEVIVTEMEHHSNIVPWQLLRERRGIVLKAAPIHNDGSLDLERLEALFTPRTRLLSVCHVSNVLGTVNPIRQLADIAHAHGAHILVDAAQSVPHFPVDVQALNCDFLAFSGHKVYGPTGIGVLYGRETLLDKMPPYQGGGEMIARVTFEKTTYERLPFKFEAGTPDYVGTHALAVALDYQTGIGMKRIHEHEQALTAYAMRRLAEIPGLTLYGTTPTKDAVCSFNIEGIHHLDLGTLLDRLGIAIRTGHHCAQPLMARYGVEGMCRASFALYNTTEEIDTLVAGIERVRKMF